MKSVISNQWISNQWVALCGLCAALCVLCVEIRAQTSTNMEVRIAITNIAGITNGATITINAQTRTFTNNISSSPSTLIHITNNIQNQATNVFRHYALYQVAAGYFAATNGLSLAGDTNAFVLVGPRNTFFTATVSSNYGYVTYATNVFTNAYPIVLPYTTEPLTQRTNQQNLEVSAISTYATTPFGQGDLALANFISISTTQTFGNKIITNSTFSGGVIDGTRITNAAGLHGTVSGLTGGLYTASFLLNPTLTNGINRGNAFRSPGSGANSEQFGSSALAAGAQALALGASASALGDNGVAIGNGALAGSNIANIAIGSGATTYYNPANRYGENAIALGTSARSSGTNSWAIGNTSVSDFNDSIAIGNSTTTTRTNEIRIGNAGHMVSIPGTLEVGTAKFTNVSAAITSQTVTNENVLAGTLTNVAIAASGATITNLQAMGGVSSNVLQLSATSSNITFKSTNIFAASAALGFTPYALTSLANGNNAAIPIATNVVVEITSGPTGVFTINGISSTGVIPGQLLILVNFTGQNMTVAHQSGTDPTAANRIITMTGADITTTGNGSAHLYYSTSQSRWILTSIEQ